MKKRVLALVMSTAMIASVLTACGGNSNDSGSAPDTNNTTTGDNNASANNNASTDNGGASTDNNAADSQAIDYGSGQIKIWVPDAVTGVTETLCNSFFEAHPEMNGYTVAIEPMGEGDAAGNVITDVEAAPDLYAFAQDQMARLVAAGALTTIGGDGLRRRYGF